MHTTRITITTIRYPSDEELNLNRELQYLCGTLGLFNPRDKDRSKFRLFIELLKARGELSADELALKLSLTRATVIHHLHNLQQAGIVDYGDGRYWMRVSSLEELVEKIRQDVAKTLNSLKDVAQRCDEGLGL